MKQMLLSISIQPNCVWTSGMCKKKVPRFKRLAEEILQVVVVLRSTTEDIAPHSVDCFRQGKYDAWNKTHSCENE